jgi:hypothetical protein
MKLFLFSLLFLLCLGENNTYLSSDLVTILITSHKSSTCHEGSISRRLCKSIPRDMIGKCNHVMMQMWAWNGSDLELITFWDPMCKYLDHSVIYRRGCAPSLNGKRYELTQFLNNYSCLFYSSVSQEEQENHFLSSPLVTLIVIVITITLLVTIIVVLCRRKRIEIQRPLMENNFSYTLL